MFYPLMFILEGEVRFPVDPSILRTLSFYSLSPDQCLPNFYRVVNYVGVSQPFLWAESYPSQHQLFDVCKKNINFLYAIRWSLKHKYYLQTRNINFLYAIRLISYLPIPTGTRGGGGEYVRVSGNWLNKEMTYPSFPRQIG